MAVTFKLAFPAGRYHATPWGRHVNEGVPEWPPSPWRLLRALIAVWKRTCRDLPEEKVRRILQPLLSPPRFKLPEFRVAHTRHYMPLGQKSPRELAGGGTTLVFDTFVCISRQDDLLVGWPDAELNVEDQADLTKLLKNLTSFGRAEGWVHAELISGSPDLPLGLARPDDPNPVPVLCPDPATALASEHFPAHDPKKLKKGLKPTEFLWDCPRWHICLDTQIVHEQKWPSVPGASWVNYSRPPEPVAAPKRSASPQRHVTVARFLIDAPVLPLVTDTLPLAEQARRSLLAIGKGIAQHENRGLSEPETWPLVPAFWGKDDQGRPRTGHPHAFFLPADEDRDGRIDHLTLLAPMGFNPLECRALRRLDRLPLGDGDYLQLALVGLGNDRDFRTPLLGPADVWESATPFIVTRYPKRRGTKRDLPEHYESPAAFTGHVLRQELDRLRARRPDLPAVVGIDPLADGIGPRRLRPIQFHRVRRKPGDDAARRPAAGFRITFANSASGPLSLGHSAHFGMGLFTATE